MIIASYNGIREDILFDGIQTRRWDPKKRPARYVQSAPLGRVFQFEEFSGPQFSNYFDLDCFNFDLLNCTNAFDIVRESDGLIASVKVERDIFFMFDWNSRLS
ncbi:Protein CBG25411 [Caenorhabditis briggsae]|nr:Protein CBG25411 [Caenorhabditis briggsae]ULU13501.1 hypothetical protein L3Y34_016183 [Caenorhabditis briggsae]UMM14460.1 hypothetical protein L5515_002257 [Caenorhabditis briggsae]CAS00563.1 Protein CBG25411 [Caenorhabditis briggsae]